MIIFSQEAFLIFFFNLQTQWQKGTSENTLNIHVPELSHARRVLLILTLASGAAARSGLITARSPQFWGSPAGALTWQYPHAWRDVSPMGQGGGQRLPGTALPFPHRPGARAGWAVADATNCIPRLLTHNLLSWVTILSLWLCHHFLVSFVRFLSPASTLWAEWCESDRGINVTFRKKALWESNFILTREHLTWMVSQSRSGQGPLSSCASTSRKQCTMMEGWEGGGKVGSGKKMPVASKAGQVGTKIPHIYQSDWSGTKWVPGFPRFMSCPKYKYY